MTDQPEKRDLDRLVKIFVRMRDKRNEAKKAFQEEDDALAEKMDTIKHALLEHCKEANVESVRTEHGTFFRAVRAKYWTSDWEAMHKFILENKVPELLEKRVAQGNMKAFLEENPDVLPAGLNIDSEYTVTVRRK